jgi:hypothetical protein
MIGNRSGAEAQQVPPIYATASSKGWATVAPRRRAYKCLRADAGAARPPGVALKFERVQSSVLGIFDHQKFFVFFWPLALFIT